VQVLEEFIRALEEEIEVLEGLIEMAREKKELVVLGKVKELQELLNREARALLALERTESERQRLHEALASEWGMPASDLRGEALLDKARELGEEGAGRLKELLDSLGRAVNALKFLNRENEDLIKQSVAFIQALERELTGGGAPTYSRSGDLRPESPPVSLLDKKI